MLVGCTSAAPPAAGSSQKDDLPYDISEDVHPLSGWQYIDGKRCYLDEHGSVVTGWAEIDGNLCYLQEDGSAASGWVTFEDGNRYFGENGIMLVGQQEIDGTTRHFASNGVEVCLVNSQYFLPEDYKVELVDVGNDEQGAAVCYDDLMKMLSDCTKAGNSPAICSGYRSQDIQEYLFDRKVTYYLDCGYPEDEATGLASSVVAIPGTSEHQLGLAFDLVDDGNWNLDESQEDTPTQQWLMENSWKYGFILRYPSDKSEITGIIYEPWHYRYVGREIAAEIHELGVCLEEYLGAD